MFVQVLERENRVAEAEEQLMSYQNNPLIFPFGCVSQKYPTTENARMIDHTPESTDSYIKDGTRVEKLYVEGYNEWEIAFFTGLPGYVVREYIEIIKDYEEEDSNKNK